MVPRRCEWRRLEEDPNVVAYSVEPTGEIIVFVKDRAKFEAEHPMLMEKRIRVHVTGEVKALGAPDFFNRAGRREVLAGGISIGHYDGATGTLASVFRDKLDGSYVLLSNWHVFGYPRGRIGDPILQPGPYDGGTRADIVGRLKRYIPLDKPVEKAPWWRRLLCRLFGWAWPQLCEGVYEANLVDAAASTIEARNASPGGIYLDDGSVVAVKGSAEPVVGMRVWKSGRTSGVNRGEILATNASVWVNYGDRVRLMRDQIVTTFMARPGDSGSLLLTEDDRAVGLLFAGSSSITVHNKWRWVSLLLDVEVP